MSDERETITKAVSMNIQSKTDAKAKRARVRPSPLAGPPPGPALDVTQLSEEHRALVEKTLVEGGTVEDAAELVRASGGPDIAPQAVARFFNLRGDLQAARVRAMVQATEELKAAAAEKGSVAAQLMDAAIMTGLMQTERGSHLTLRQALNAKLAQETLELRKENMDLKVKKAQDDELLNTHRINREMERTKLLRLQVEQLKKMMDEEKPDLKPHLMDKIHQIYGLSLLPDIPEAETSGQ